MRELRLRIKFGEHKFECEGPADHVERRFESFKRMVMPESPPPFTVQSPQITIQAPVLPAAVVAEMLMLDKIIKVDGRVVSLSVRSTVEEAILTILLGQRQIRQNNSVSGVEIMNGLRESGLDVPRADTILGKYARAGLVVAMGRRKLRRYRLSTDGIVHAEQVAHRLIDNH